MSMTNGAEQPIPVYGESRETAIQAAVENAHVLALEANEYFDQRYEDAVSVSLVLRADAYNLSLALSEVDPVHRQRLVGIYEAAHDDTSLQDKFDQSDRSFASYKKMAEVAMPPIAAFELPLTPEQKQKAAQVKTAMAEKFGREETDFSVIRTVDEDGNDHYSVALISTKGVDFPPKPKKLSQKRLYSYQDIVADPEDERFIIEVDGAQIDTREAVTDSAILQLIKLNPKIKGYIWVAASGIQTGLFAPALNVVRGAHIGPKPTSYIEQDFEDSESQFYPVVRI